MTKGVNPVARHGVVRRLYSTDGSSATHLARNLSRLLTTYFGTPSMFITLWFGFDYGTNPPLGTLII
jgi:hypothetical protein